jgi:hypothetical protein
MKVITDKGKELHPPQELIAPREQQNSNVTAEGRDRHDGEGRSALEHVAL